MNDVERERIWGMIRKQKEQFNISFSLMDSYNKCPRQMLLKTLVPRELVSDNEANVIGPSAAHSLFEDWVSKVDYEQGWMQANFEEYFRRQEDKAKKVVYKASLSQKLRDEWGVKSDREYQLAKLFKGVCVLEQVAVYSQFRQHKIVTEQWITIQIPGQDYYYLKAAVDIFDPVTRTIYDIKLTLNAQYGNKLQLYFYGLLHYYNSHIMPLRVAFLYPLLQPAVREVDFSPESLNEAAAATKKFVQRIEAADFPVQPSSSNDCFWCSYKTWCPKYGGDYGVERPLEAPKVWYNAEEEVEHGNNISGT